MKIELDSNALLVSIHSFLAQKFIDLAVASDADYIVTNDSHFNSLKEVTFPRIKVITIEEFLQTVNNL